MPAPDPTLSRLVRLHAETTQALGVDFLPAYRTGATPAGLTSEASTPATRPAPAADIAQPPKPVPAPEPPRRAPAPTSPSQPQPAPIQPAPGPSGAPLLIPASPPLPPPPSSRDRASVERAMDELRRRYEQDAPHRHFVTAHTKIVWGDGDPTSRLVFVGEAPGEDEDRQGIPFVGRSGQLLNKMIAAMGLSRERVYICNVLKTRPPNNATPTQREIELCEPYLRAQLAVIAPEVIVSLGLPAARALLRSDESMTRLRGRWRTYTLDNGHAIRLMPTYHPAYVLRNYTAETRALVWSDLRQVMDALGMAPPAPSAGT
jgi:DNA polymerase